MQNWYDNYVQRRMMTMMMMIWLYSSQISLFTIPILPYVLAKQPLCYHLIIEFYCSWLWQKYPVVHSHSNCLATPWKLLLRVTISLTWIINEFVTPQATSLMLIQKDSIHELKTQSMLEVVNTFSELKDIFQG